MKSIINALKSPNSRVPSFLRLQPQKRDQERPLHGQRHGRNRARAQGNLNLPRPKILHRVPRTILSMSLSHPVWRSAAARYQRHQLPRKRMGPMPFGAQHAHLVQNHSRSQKKMRAAPSLAGRRLDTAVASHQPRARARGLSR